MVEKNGGGHATPTKTLLFFAFLSAAQPTDLGEDSVVLLVVVVVVVVGGAPFFSLPCTVFWGVKRQKLCLKRGVKRQKLCQKYYFPRRRSVKVSLSCLKDTLSCEGNH